MSHREAVILDIDGTVSPGISWQDLTRDLGGSVEEHMIIFNALRAADISLEAAKKQLVELYQATGKADRNSIQRVLENWPLKLNALSMVTSLKNNGYEICLITGSFLPFAKTVAAKLDIEHYYANSDLVFDDDGRLIDFDYTLDQAGQKLEHFEEFCTKTGIDPKSCYAVGDSENDIGIFEHTGRGILLADGNAETDITDKAWRVVATLEEAAQLIVGKEA